jgi:hypothetical protein
VTAAARRLQQRIFLELATKNPAAAYGTCQSEIRPNTLYNKCSEVLNSDAESKESSLRTAACMKNASCRCFLEK